jgi:hypothetical protein
LLLACLLQIMECAAEVTFIIGLGVVSVVAINAHMPWNQTVYPHSVGRPYLHD